MRIDSTSSPTPISATESRDAKPATTKRAGSEASVVKLSSAGISAAASASDGEENPMITAKLSHIRALLDKGEYPVDLDRLASRIVDDEITRGSK
ncbi:MAG: hypothetical protein NT062_06570 [Proteobacteria bacterium]|nr:hypothetical protein [Pseudomonadota bacterium]